MENEDLKLLFDSWDENLIFQQEELERNVGWDEPFSGYYDSSSPDGAASSAGAKNIISERNRRKKLNDRLFALRAVVPKISKMDKASIIKDAIEYIQELHEQERKIQAEILDLESGRSKNTISNFDQEDSFRSRSKKKRTDQGYDSGGSRSSSIEIIELRISYVGERTLVISLTCDKKTDTMVKLCEAFESLNLKIITANIAALSGKLLQTVFVEADAEEKEELKFKIETAIAAVNDPQSPMSY